MRDNECICIMWARRGTAAINTACPSRGGKSRVSDRRGINLNLITQLPSEPEQRCVRALPLYVLHSNRTDLLILNGKRGDGILEAQIKESICEF